MTKKSQNAKGESEVGLEGPDAESLGTAPATQEEAEDRKQADLKFEKWLAYHINLLVRLWRLAQAKKDSGAKEHGYEIELYLDGDSASDTRIAPRLSNDDLKMYR